MPDNPPVEYAVARSAVQTATLMQRYCTLLWLPENDWMPSPYTCTHLSAEISARRCANTSIDRFLFGWSMDRNHLLAAWEAVEQTHIDYGPLLYSRYVHHASFTVLAQTLSMPLRTVYYHHRIACRVFLTTLHRLCPIPITAVGSGEDDIRADLLIECARE